MWSGGRYKFHMAYGISMTYRNHSPIAMQGKGKTLGPKMIFTYTYNILHGYNRYNTRISY